MTAALTAELAEAERLLTEAGSDQVAALPMLSGAELWALCGTHQVLADERELSWWNRKTEAQRQALTDAILDLLRIRNLVCEGGRDDGSNPVAGPLAPRVPLVPALALVVAARQRPIVAAIGVAADGPVAGTPRMFGLAGDGEPVRAFVAEYISTQPLRSPVGPPHRFSLLAPAKAGHVLAIWAAASSRTSGFLRRTHKQRTVDVIRWRRDAPLSRDRLAVAGDHEPFEVTRQRPGADPETGLPGDTSELARQPTRMPTEE